MDRVAFIPTLGACPFMAAAFMDNYDKVWGNKVNRLFVMQNGAACKELRDFMRWRVDKSANTVLISANTHIGHGNAIRQMFDNSTEEYIVLLEDDSYILDPSFIDECFGYLERGERDFAGQLRAADAPDLMRRTQEVFNLPTIETTFHPCFAFGKRSDYLKTDLLFVNRFLSQFLSEVLSQHQEYSGFGMETR